MLFLANRNGLPFLFAYRTLDSFEWFNFNRQYVAIIKSTRQRDRKKTSNNCICHIGIYPSSMLSHFVCVVCQFRYYSTRLRTERALPFPTLAYTYMRMCVQCVYGTRTLSGLSALRSHPLAPRTVCVLCHATAIRMSPIRLCIERECSIE